MESIVIKPSRVFSVLLICFILAMPLNNCFEVFAMMNRTLASSDPSVSAWTIVLTPLYIKAFKDVFAGLSVVLLMITCIKSPGRARMFTQGPFVLLNLFVVIIIASALWSITFMPASVVFMGVRGYWAIAFIYVGACFSNLSERKIYPYIVAVFSLHFLLQIYQWITDVGYLVYFSHNRCPGLFITGSTSGAFALLVHYFSIRFKSTPLKILSIVSLLLSNSTNGLLIFVAYYIYAYRDRLRPKAFFYPLYAAAAALVSYELIANLGEITGRGEGAAFSATTRLEILSLALANWTSLVFGIGMGVASAQATITGISNAVIADNTYVGIMYNAGIFPSVIMLVFIVLSFRYFEHPLLALTLVGYSLTTVVFELNPIIQILLILLGVHIGRRTATIPAKSPRRMAGDFPGLPGFPVAPWSLPE